MRHPPILWVIHFRLTSPKANKSSITKSNREQKQRMAKWKKCLPIMQNGKICEFNKQQVGSQERKKGSWYGWGIFSVGVAEGVSLVVTLGHGHGHGHVDFLHSPFRSPQDIWPNAVDSLCSEATSLFLRRRVHIFCTHFMLMTCKWQKLFSTNYDRVSGSIQRRVMSSK